MSVSRHLGDTSPNPASHKTFELQDTHDAHPEGEAVPPRQNHSQEDHNILSQPQLLARPLARSLARLLAPNEYGHAGSQFLNIS